MLEYSDFKFASQLEKAFDSKCSSGGAGFLEPCVLYCMRTDCCLIQRVIPPT